MKKEGKDQHCRSKYNARERKETEFVGVSWCVCVCGLFASALLINHRQFGW
jgi:hypothetical protein